MDYLSKPNNDYNQEYQTPTRNRTGFMITVIFISNSNLSLS